jgi:pyrimidine-nucleoside phosphorylase
MMKFLPAELIQKKRDGKELSAEEIKFFISGVLNGEVADYQATAFMMATFFQGMTLNETCALTQAMTQSGEQHEFKDPSLCLVDKHSTGGVGDKVSIILAPLAAACGLHVPMMAGRGLGFSGGTLDKLESIPGFNILLSREKFEEIVSKVGCAIIGQSEKIAPADRKLYALRDVTATIECHPLIAASILSKKLAEGTRALVLDVKVGNGAFMKTKTSAQALAKLITQVGKRMGLLIRAVLTDMNQPLGFAAGNTLEVLESIEVLTNAKLDLSAFKNLPERSSADLKTLTIHLVAEMLLLAKKVKSLNDGRKLAHQKIEDHSALKVFHEWISAQGGNLNDFSKIESLPLAPKKITWTADRGGYLNLIQTENIGRLLIELGAGRKRAEDQVDHGVGLVFHKKLGAKIKKGDPLVTVFTKPRADLKDLEQYFKSSISISSSKAPVPKLIHQVI